MLLFHSKLGGEASLSPLAPPLPPTSTSNRVVSTLSVTFHTKNQARKLTSKKHACVGHRGIQKAKCEQTWLPKRLQDRAQNHHKTNFRRLRVKRADPVKTSVFTVSNTHRTPPGLNNFLYKPASEHCEKRSRKKTDKGAQQNACRVDFWRQRSQNVSQKAPN